jgi:DNA-nicking Smr family endonuclease
VRRRGRELTGEEAALWRAVARSVTPLEAVPQVELATSLEDAPSPRLPPRPAAPAPPKPARTRRPAPRLDAGDPKEARKVARGRREIDATLDLHGLTQDAAHERLCRFVETAQAAGARTLLVVTGKGAGEARVPFAEAPRGILRQRFLEWVEAPPLSPRIASVRGAHQRHGGGGAFYVMVKRKRAQR